MPLKDNTVRIKYPQESAKPTENEIVKFLVKHGIVGDDVSAVYPDVRAKCYFVKFVSNGLAERFIDSAASDNVFEYSNKVTTNVQVYDANEDVKIIRIFEIAPEISDDDIHTAFQEFGTIKQITWEKKTVESGFFFYNGVRVIQINMTKEIPDRILIAGEKKRVNYPGMTEKCFRCNQVGHKRFQCPLSAQSRLNNATGDTTLNLEDNFPPLPITTHVQSTLPKGLSDSESDPNLLSVQQIVENNAQYQQSLNKDNQQSIDTQHAVVPAHTPSPQPPANTNGKERGRPKDKKFTANSATTSKSAGDNGATHDGDTDMKLLDKPIDVEEQRRQQLAKLRDRSKLSNRSKSKTKMRSRSNSPGDDTE